MAAISSLISSPSSFLHHHSSSKPFTAQQQPATSSKFSFLRSNSVPSSKTSLKSLFSPLIANPREPRMVFVVAEEKETAPATRDPSSEAARRLYVGNIPRSVTNDDLRKMFEEHGAVEKAEVMFHKETGKSRRFGFVTMKTVEEANAAIENLNEKEIEDRKIKVNITEKPLETVDLSLLREPQFIDSPHKVYVGNLAKTVTSDSLKALFAEKGKVLSARVSRNPGTSKSSGFGFVTFSSEEDVEAAISMFNNTMFEKQKIRVNKA